MPRDARFEELRQLLPSRSIAMLRRVDKFSMELRQQELAARQSVHG
jgi:hypothetical protein